MMPYCKSDSSLWGIVLAGGSGVRLNGYVRRRFGRSTPKQYLAFTGKRSMLEHTLDRAEMLIRQDRIVTVIDSSHKYEAKRCLENHPLQTTLRQPCNLDTAPGLLLPLTAILERDPNATVAILPSDHFVLQEKRFMSYVSAASKAVEKSPKQIVMLGILPTTPDKEYGYIQPGSEIGSHDGASLRRIERFHEKPELELAGEYCRQGYLWNTFVMVARAARLFDLIVKHLPELGFRFNRIRKHWSGTYRDFILAEEYRAMEPVNVSRRVFEQCPQDIAVMPIWGVNWSDWGTSRRIEETLKEINQGGNHGIGVAANSVFGSLPAWTPDFPYVEAGIGAC